MYFENLSQPFLGKIIFLREFTQPVSLRKPFADERLRSLMSPNRGILLYCSFLLKQVSLATMECKSEDSGNVGRRPLFNKAFKEYNRVEIHAIGWVLYKHDNI